MARRLHRAEPRLHLPAAATRRAPEQLLPARQPGTGGRLIAVAGGGQRIPNVDRIAVLRANALGDLVVALPALEALRAAYPGAEIALLGRQHHVDLLGSRQGPVDRVIPLPDGAIGDEANQDPRLDREALLGDLAGNGFDLAIQLHGGGRNSNRFVRGLRARVTAGSRTPDAPHLDRWIPYEHYQWEIARYLEVVGLVGAEPVAIEPRLEVTDADRGALDRELPGVRTSHPVVVHPGASDARRRWPVERFIEVVAELRRLGRQVVVTGTEHEAHLVEPIVESAGEGATAALTLSLPALLALVASADLVVSNDTGPLHLAIAAGTPTVGLFWVGNLINAGPFSRRQHRPLLSWRMLCPVCGTDASVDRCEHNPSFIAEIPVRSVIEAATDLLQAR